MTELKIKILNNVEKCWKCGIILTNSNMSSSAYMSNPPKYTCIDCENKKVKETIMDLIEINAL
jgi:hypothetical protein